MSSKSGDSKQPCSKAVCDSRSLPSGNETTSLNNPAACPYGECDGSEIIITADENGIQVAKPCRCSELRIMKNKLKFANIPAEFENLTIKSFSTDMYDAEESIIIARNIKKIAIQFVKRFEEMKQSGKGLYLFGETKGSGKTRMAVSIGNALISQCNADVKFVTTLNLIEEIKSTWDNIDKRDSGKTQSKLLAAIKEIEVLILDDFGTEKPTSWVNEIFYNILNDRMTANKITIFTSNCRIESLRHDERIVNRLPKMAIPIGFPEESIRTALAQSENEEILKSFLG